MQEGDVSANGSADSVGELVQRLSQQTAALVRQELHLAQLEFKEKGKRAGIGAGLFGVSALIGLGAFGALVAGLILLVAEAVDTWIAAFIVAAGLAVIAGATALGGKKEVQQAVPPKPEAAMESIQADVAEVKARAARA
jgi:MFS family permease